MSSFRHITKWDIKLPKILKQQLCLKQANNFKKQVIFSPIVNNVLLYKL